MKTFKEIKAQIKENAFNWKSNKSDIDWKDLDNIAAKSKQSASGGAVYKARETERDAEQGGKKIKPKQNVGRPAGEYGSYKIDKNTRETPEYKAALSAKVQAAKAEGFAIRAEFMAMMDAALHKREMEIASGHNQV